MDAPHTQAFQTLASGQHRAEPLGCRAVREQLAVVRALADELERLTNSDAGVFANAQFADELARLGRRVLDAAVALSAARPLKSVHKKGGERFRP